MVEIEHIQDIEKDQPAKSSAKEQKLEELWKREPAQQK